MNSKSILFIPMLIMAAIISLPTLSSENEAYIDHRLWQQVLDRYLVEDHISGINRVDYQAIKNHDNPLLDNYLNYAATIDVERYSRAEQMAFWINLYNAVTVKLIVDNYPVASITKLGQKLLAFGPWDDPLITVNGEPLTLNNIEHDILRQQWQDYRIHFAVNCASLGCPNLRATAFTSANLESELEAGAREFLRHQRGLALQNNELTLSSIFDWYKDDFGHNRQQRLLLLSSYLPQGQRAQVTEFTGKIRYQYDWKLNEVEPGAN